MSLRFLLQYPDKSIPSRSFISSLQLQRCCQVIASPINQNNTAPTLATEMIGSISTNSVTMRAAMSRRSSK